MSKQFNNLKTSIAAVIKNNGANEIDGYALQQKLLSMVDSMELCNFEGFADTETVPVTDATCDHYYVAIAQGVYENFDSFVVTSGDVVIFSKGIGESTWTKTNVASGLKSMISALDNAKQAKLTAGGGIGINGTTIGVSVDAEKMEIVSGKVSVKDTYVEGKAGSVVTSRKGVDIASLESGHLPQSQLPAGMGYLTEEEEAALVANVNTAISGANSAASAATSAASNATTAASTATTAASTADAATGRANAATSSANSAAQTASTAAQSAQTAISSVTGVVAECRAEIQSSQTATANATTAASNANTATASANAATAQLQAKLNTADADHTRANTDHSTATADHTQAGTDHTNAVNQLAQQATTFQQSEASRAATFASKEAERDAAIASVTDFEDKVADLDRELNEEATSINLSNYEYRGGVIDTSQATGWQSRSTKGHYIIPVYGDEKVNVVSNNGTCYYSFLKESPTYISDGGTLKPQTFPKFAQGYSSVLTLSANNELDLSSPSDAKYLYVENFGTSRIAPKSIVIGEDSTYKQMKEALPYLYYSGEIKYSGEKISLLQYSCTCRTWMNPGGSTQGCAIHNGHLFIYDGNGKVTIYNIVDKNKIAEFNIYAYDTAMPHGNCLFFGKKYSSDDPLPVLYINAYTNQLANGVVYGYRISVNGNSYSATCVHKISIGFTNTSKWSDGNDRRPYGNFVYNNFDGCLYAYTLLDTTNVTRFFKVPMPSFASLEVTIAESDIIDYFDVDYIAVIQDSCCNGDKVYVLSGESGKSKLSVVDVFRKSIVSGIDLTTLGYTYEPEWIDIYDGSFYFGSSYGFKLNV